MNSLLSFFPTAFTVPRKRPRAHVTTVTCRALIRREGHRLNPGGRAEQALGWWRAELLRRDPESLLLLRRRGANRLRRRHGRRFGPEIAHGHIIPDVGNVTRSHSNPTCRGLGFGIEVAYGHIVSDVIHLIFANPNPPERSSASSGRFHQDRRRRERGRAVRRYLLHP